MTGLAPFADSVWTAEGPTIRAALGFAYPTRMAVVRLSAGGVLVWSPVALAADLKAQVDRIGPVVAIVAPNSLHHVFLGEWMAAYPRAVAHGVRRLRSKRPDLVLGPDLDDAPDPTWSSDIDQTLVRGNAITEEAVFFHRPSATIIFADLLQQLPTRANTGWRSAIARWDLMTGDQPAVPRKFRWAFRSRAAARAAAARLLAWPTERMIIAHGPLVTSNGRARLREALLWLTPPDL